MDYSKYPNHNLLETTYQTSSYFLGVCGLNFAHRHDSASRLHMLSNQLGQMLVINGATPRGIQTGMEREYAKATFNVRMPADGTILEIVPMYRLGGAGRDAIAHNPMTAVIYEDAKTKEIGVFYLEDYCSMHQYFGYKYNKGKDFGLLYPGSKVPEGAVFLESPSVTPDGDYCYGIEANVAYMTHPATSEDSILVSRDFLRKLGFIKLERRIVEYGYRSNKVALNLYGDDENYKPFPDIGEKIRDDGLLAALRPTEPIELAVVEQSRRDLREVDFYFDETIYADGPGGTVVDIRVHRDLNSVNHADVNMDEQVAKYDVDRRAFYRRIEGIYKKYHRQRGASLQITPEFNQLLMDAAVPLSEEAGQRVQKQYRKQPLDTFRIEFVIRYDVVPNIGFKLTDCHGGN